MNFCLPQWTFTRRMSNLPLVSAMHQGVFSTSVAEQWSQVVVISVPSWFPTVGVGRKRVVEER